MKQIWLLVALLSLTACERERTVDAPMAIDIVHGVFPDRLTSPLAEVTAERQADIASQIKRDTCTSARAAQCQQRNWLIVSNR